MSDGEDDEIENNNENERNKLFENENLSSKMASIHGHIEPYTMGDDFALYKARLGHFISLNKVTEDTAKVDILASFGGADLFKTLHTLIQPDKIEEKKYDDLIAALENHFKPKHNTVAESFKFNKRNQRKGESLAQYIVELKSMAQLCDFGDFLDRALKDRFICGISNESIQSKLFNDSSVNTFHKACEIAQTMESTKSNIQIIHNDSDGNGFDGDGSVNLMQHSDKRASYGKNNGNSNNNYNSYSKGHGNNNNNGKHSKSFSGHSKSIQCYSCGLNGHIARNCFRRQGKFNGKSINSDKKTVNLKHFTDDFDNFNDFNFEHQYLNTLYSFSPLINTVKSGALTTLIDMNGRDVRMEIDTGATGTVFPDVLFFEYFPGSQLSPPKRNFSLLSGESVRIVGSSVVSVNRNNRSHQLGLHVIKASENVLPLMGQDWLDDSSLTVSKYT